MEVDINPQLKPLYANLLRLGIEEYLISERFEHLCIGNNIDNLWDQCENYVRSSSSVAVLIPGFTDYAKRALGLFLDKIFITDKTRFFEMLIIILIDFEEWANKDLDMTIVIESLTKLGYLQSQVEFELKRKKGKSIDSTVAQKFFIPKINKEVDKTLCFVLMPFDEKFKAIYDDIIKKVVEESRLKCLRVDEIFSTKPIIEDILNNIQKAHILIADLTGKNPNVFYELGFAHAINKRVILITQELKDVPFDIKHYRYIVYEDSIGGAEKLKKRLKDTIKEELGEK